MLALYQFDCFIKQIQMQSNCLELSFMIIWHWFIFKIKYLYSDNLAGICLYWTAIRIQVESMRYAFEMKLTFCFAWGCEDTRMRYFKYFKTYKTFFFQKSETINTMCHEDIIKVLLIFLFKCHLLYIFAFIYQVLQRYILGSYVLPYHA